MADGDETRSSTAASKNITEPTRTDLLQRKETCSRLHGFKTLALSCDKPAQLKSDGGSYGHLADMVDDIIAKIRAIQSAQHAESM